MAISKLGGTGSDNWELISSVTPTVSTAINFTGLSPYKKLMLTATDITLSSSSFLRLRLNNDSAGDAYFANYNTGTSLSSLQDTYYALGQSSSSNHSGYIMFSSTDNAGLKIVENGYFVGSTIAGYMNGYYLGGAIINQVNLYSLVNFTAAGTVALYGVK